MTRQCTLQQAATSRACSHYFPPRSLFTFSAATNHHPHHDTILSAFHNIHVQDFLAGLLQQELDSRLHFIEREHKTVRYLLSTTKARSSPSPLHTKKMTAQTNAPSATISRMVSTFRPTCDGHRQKVVELSPLDEEGAKSLHREDPFLFYSIAEARRAAMYGREDDFVPQETTRVRRRTKVSFEAHPSAIMMDMFQEELLSE